MSFEYASVTKTFMIGIALTSAVAGIFDLKHYLNLQLVPHISKHHQYWRLLVHPLACASSSDLLLTELLLYNVGIPIERAFGGAKYASFVVISAVTTMLVSFVTLLLAQLTPMTRANFNNIPGGPFAILFAIVYQYVRLVPAAYHFRVFGLGMSDKIWIYAIAFQVRKNYLRSMYRGPSGELSLSDGHMVTWSHMASQRDGATRCPDVGVQQRLEVPVALEEQEADNVFVQLTVARLPVTLLPTVVGLFVGYLYRSDVLQLKSWRLPPRLVRLAEEWVKPLLGEDKPVRRTHRVLPEPRAQGGARGSRRAVNLDDDEVVTTARSTPRRRIPRSSSGRSSNIEVDSIRNPAGETPSAGANGSEEARDRAETGAAASATGSGMVRQWMSELASGARPVAQGGGTVRAPSENEIGTLTDMFPDMDREAVLGVLQRSPNIEAAAETLLTAQSTS